MLLLSGVTSKFKLKSITAATIIAASVVIYYEAVIATGQLWRVLVLLLYEWLACDFCRLWYLHVLNVALVTLIAINSLNDLILGYFDFREIKLLVLTLWSVLNNTLNDALIANHRLIIVVIIVVAIYNVNWWFLLGRVIVVVYGLLLRWCVILLLAAVESIIECSHAHSTAEPWLTGDSTALLQIACGMITMIAIYIYHTTRGVHNTSTWQSKQHTREVSIVVAVQVLKHLDCPALSWKHLR